MSAAGPGVIATLVASCSRGSGWRNRVMARVVTAPATNATRPRLKASFSFNHPINLSTPCAMAWAEGVPDVPLAAATAAAVTPAGAACTELVATAPAMTATLNVKPRRVKLARSLSKPRTTRFCAARSSRPNAPATSRRLLFSKKRNSSASRSFSRSSAIASSKKGASCSQAGPVSDWSAIAFI